MRFIFRSFRLSAPRATSAAEVNITPALPKGAKRQTPKTRRPAKGSPTRGAVTAKPVTERFSPDAGSRNPDAVTAKPVTERFNPESDSSDPQKEAHSDAPAGQ